MVGLGDEVKKTHFQLHLFTVHTTKRITKDIHEFF